MAVDYAEFVAECRKEYIDMDAELLGFIEFCNKYGGEETSTYWCIWNCARTKLIEAYGAEYSSGFGKKMIEHCIKGSNPF